MACSRENHIRKLANAMQGLADSVNSQTPHIKVGPLIEVCRMFDLDKFGCGADFHFANLEIADQTKAIETKVGGADETVRSVVERDIAQVTVDKFESLSRILYRLKRIIELAMEIMERCVANKGNESLADSIEVAYTKVFAPFHGPSIKHLYAFAKPAIPTMPNFLLALGEDEDSVMEPFNKYVAAAKVVISHIEAIFQSHKSTAKITRRV